MHQGSRARTGKRWRRSVFAVLVLLLALCQGMSAQTVWEQSAQDTEQQEARGAAQAKRNVSTETDQLSFKADTQEEVLSAQEIESILELHPELTDAIKQQTAQRLQKQGTQVYSEDISDDVLEQQIAGSEQLRASLTKYLQAHGFVSRRVQQQAGQTNPEEEVARGLVRRQVQERENSEEEMLSANERYGPAKKKVETQSVDSTTESGVLRKPPPYPLESLRDLYTQVPQSSAPLKRFGAEFFRTTTGARALLRGAVPGDAPLDVPVGPDYVVSAGDTLQVSFWGAAEQTVTREVGRDGRLMLPDAGAITVAGLTLRKTEELIGAALRQQYRNAQVAVTVSRFHSVRIYVAGDVQRPGGYDVSAMASPLSALYAAGGPTASGSLRMLRHMRGQTQVEVIDLYDFFLHGVHASPVHLESGDTLLVPTVGPQVAVAGAVKRPAVYELRDGKERLNSVVEDAGGFTVAASLTHISVERVDVHRGRETLQVGQSGAATEEQAESAVQAFHVQDGDRVNVSPVLPYSERVVYLEGHVARPGRHPFHDGMRLSELLHSYSDLLPEPASQGEIVRLVAPDLHAETIDFDVHDALIGNVDPALQPFDTVRVRGRYEEDAPEVTIHGEVLRPGVYPLSEGMTAAQLVRMAGGFKRDALLERADIASYSVQDGREVVGNLRVVRIGNAVANGADDVPLHAGDILTIHQITGWTDIGEAVTLEGQVNFPGSYGFTEGEHLSSVLRRAGGFRSTAYPEGAVLVREQVRELETKSRDELIRQIETNSAAARLSPNLGNGDTGATLQMIKAQQDEVLAQLKAHPAAGRLVVHLSADIDSWANTPADIELRRGDKLTVPKRPGFVLVTGQVYNATALTFTPGKTAAWYLARAGGANTTANRKEIFVIRANGSVVGRRSGGWFQGDVLATKLDPGDVVVVPQKILGSSLVWRNLLTTAQLASSIAITAAVAGL